MELMSYEEISDLYWTDRNLGAVPFARAIERITTQRALDVVRKAESKAEAIAHLEHAMAKEIGG